MLNELLDILGIQQYIDERKPFMVTYLLYIYIYTHILTYMHNSTKQSRESLWLCAGLQTLWALQWNFNYGKMYCQALIQTLNYQRFTTTYY